MNQFCNQLGWYFHYQLEDQFVYMDAQLNWRFNDQLYNQFHNSVTDELDYEIECQIASQILEDLD